MNNDDAFSMWIRPFAYVVAPLAVISTVILIIAVVIAAIFTPTPDMDYLTGSGDYNDK
jgi:hypothetical protein